jgi:ABC-type polysaccharide/polyol phosphate transport system ATPase subunit
MGSIEALCDRVAWLDHGKVVNIGSTKEVVREFQNFMSN